MANFVVREKHTTNSHILNKKKQKTMICREKLTANCIIWRRENCKLLYWEQINKLQKYYKTSTRQTLVFGEKLMIKFYILREDPFNF